MVVYEVFKRLATRLSVFLFLGIQLEDPLFEEVSQLMTTHWRGTGMGVVCGSEGEVGVQVERFAWLACMRLHVIRSGIHAFPHN